MTIDPKDRAILDLLCKDSKLSHQQIAEMLGSSQASVWRRIKSLEDRGIIEGYGARINQEKLGLELTAYALITLNRHSRDSVGDFEKQIRRSPAILECHSVTGQADYILKIRTENIRAYELFLNDTLFHAPGVDHVHTSISLRAVKE